ncbi:MAG: response regulator [Anaerolineae bacterium]
MADETEALVKRAHQWAAREMKERGAAPSELLLIADGLSRIVRDLLPAKKGLDQVVGRFNLLTMALAQYFAGEAERLEVEKSQLETLYEITRELSASLDQRRALQKALQEVTTAIAAEMGAVFLADGKAGQVAPEAKVNWSGEAVDLTAFPSAWRLGQSAPPLVLNDLQAEETEAWARTLAGPDVASLIVAPLIANGEFRGLLAAASSRPGAFSSSHARLFHNVLSQISTAISNAEVYRLISEQAQELGLMLRRQQEEGTKRQAILTSIGDGVVVNDTEGKIILVNPVAERILGMSSDELIGQDFRALFSVFGTEGEAGGAGGKEAIVAMEKLLTSPVPGVAQSFKMRLTVGKRVIHALLSPVLTQRGDFLGVVTVFRDITKEVEADRAKNEFVSTVSHELRTPMTSIKGYTDLLYAGAAGSVNTEQQRFLGIIKNNTDRLTALVNDLLDISRVETGRIRFEPGPVQIGEIVADVVNVLAGQAEAKHQTLTYEVVGGLPNIMGDEDRLNQVLTNLVGNAIHYTPEGGEIEVRVYPVEGAVRVDVRDTGIGIAPEDVGHIFERFYRADHPLVQETRGTGLGLSIVKMFVEMHGGRIWVESEVGEGSTFTLVLPVPARPEEEEGRWTPLQLMARTRKILVVDDDGDVAHLIQRQLEGCGYQVSTLGRGGSVEAWAEENQPDLILLDLILPDVGGIEVLHALKDNPVTTDIPVIALTIVPDDGTAWNLGVVDYLTKPMEAEDLQRSVEKALTWRGRILIVEDDRDTAEMLSAAMRQVGFTPLVAVDGYEALAMARRYRLDLILLDLRLPGMDGYEALTHLKRDAVTQTIPIIAISAHVSDVEQEQKRLIALGAATFMPKPFSIGELLNEIEAALQPVSPLQ